MFIFHAVGEEGERKQIDATVNGECANRKEIPERPGKRCARDKEATERRNFKKRDDATAQFGIVAGLRRDVGEDRRNARRR